MEVLGLVVMVVLNGDINMRKLIGILILVAQELIIVVVAHIQLMLELLYMRFGHLQKKEHHIHYRLELQQKQQLLQIH